jgi:DNA-binding transcriptional MerR regulator
MMQNWMAIGKFSKIVQLSPRTLRIYESIGLIKPYNRGENNYRYYKSDQIQIVEKIKNFKCLGFSLQEIQSLIKIDSAIDADKMKSILEKKKIAFEIQKDNINSTLELIESAISNLNQDKKKLSLQERKFIMNHFENISVVVAGTRDLKKTAHYIETHIAKGGKNIPVTVWNDQDTLPQTKPYILVISEDQLQNGDFTTIAPDVVVIKELSKSSSKIHKAYLKLYSAVGPNMSTILNADDRAVVELAGNETIRAGKTYYFSKNKGLQFQISKIGGVVSDGEKVKVYGLNHKAGPLEINLNKILGVDEETAYLASLAAIMDFGLDETLIQNSNP